MTSDSLPPWLAFEPERAERVVTDFLSEYADRVGADGYVVGISGGIDSATSAMLAARAVGAERVELLSLPGPTSTGEDEAMAQATAKAVGAGLDRVDIGPATGALADALGGEVDRVVRGNLQARLRMAVLYARANAGNRLVLGTGNKSELLTGYFTKHGDGGVDLLPLGDLYKTQIRRLAERLGVPQDVIDRPPTAGLWEGQRDEEELGLPYAQLDVVLAGIEQQFEDARIADEAGVGEDDVARVRRMIETSAHKRNPPPVAEL